MQEMTDEQRDRMRKRSYAMSGIGAIWFIISGIAGLPRVVTFSGLVLYAAGIVVYFVARLKK